MSGTCERYGCTRPVHAAKSTTLCFPHFRGARCSATNAKRDLAVTPSGRVASLVDFPIDIAAEIRRAASAAGLPVNHWIIAACRERIAKDSA